MRRRYFIKQRRTHLIYCLSQFFPPGSKYTAEISENSSTFLDIKLSINDNGLSTSVHYKPTDSHSYLRHSSSHPQHVKNAIPFSQFLRLRRLYSDDSDFNNKCEELCQFFKNTRLPWLCYNHMQTSRPRNRLRPQKPIYSPSPTIHKNLSIKNVTFKTFKILHDDPETKHSIFFTTTHFIQTRQKLKYLSSWESI